MFSRKIKDYYGHGKTPGEIGIEIEMEGHYLPSRFSPSSPWMGTHDGSLRGESVEYVLRKPVKREEVAGCLDSLNQVYERKGSALLPSDRCGVHIHINMQQSSILHTINTIILYLMFEDVLVKWCGEDREGNLFCLRASDAEANIMYLQQAVQNRSFRFGNEVRYASINLSSLDKFGSLEFRALRTPKDMADIKTWAEILLAIKDASEAFDYPSDIISSLSGRGPVAFFRDIMKDKSDLLEFNGFDKCILDGMRRVQYLAMMKQYREKAPVKKLVGFGGGVDDAVGRMDFLRGFPNAPLEQPRFQPAPPPRIVDDGPRINNAEQEVQDMDFVIDEEFDEDDL